MEINIFISNSYKRPPGYRTVAGLILLWALPPPGMAGDIYQWTDTAGVMHFSDSAPSDPQADSRKLGIAPVPATPAQGLRPGERTTLQVLEKRVQRQHRAAQMARQRNDHALAAHRSDCRAHRDRLRTAGDRTSRKSITTYLHRNCW